MRLMNLARDPDQTEVIRSKAKACGNPLETISVGNSASVSGGEPRSPHAGVLSQEVVDDHDAKTVGPEVWAAGPPPGGGH